jgi:hypothetical protein
LSTNLLKKISSGNGVDARQEFSLKSLFSKNNGFNKEKTSQFSGLWLTRKKWLLFPYCFGEFRQPEAAMAEIADLRR